MAESAAYQVTGSGIVTSDVGDYGIVAGWSLTEVAGTAVRVQLRDGPSATGHIVASVQIPANGSTGYSLLPDVKCNGGVYVNVIGGGTVEGAIFIQ